MKASLVILFMSFAMSVSCTMHEEDREPIHHSNTDSTTYIFYNRTNKNVCVTMSEHTYSYSTKKINISAADAATLSIMENKIFPGYPLYADSCMFAYNDGIMITFFPRDFDWGNPPITPKTHNDSLYVNYPFRHSNCKITVSNINEGKQRVTCEYVITEDDYEFAKMNGK